MRAIIRPDYMIRSGAFTLLLLATLILAFLYLSGAVGVARHDFFYTLLLAAAWCLYYAHAALLQTRMLGPLLRVAGRVLTVAALASALGFLYWLILLHG